MDGTIAFSASSSTNYPFEGDFDSRLRMQQMEITITTFLIAVKEGTEI
jgi:hypothetical protein